MKKKQKTILIILSVIITGCLFDKQIVWFCSRTLIEFHYFGNLSPIALNQASIDLINTEIKATDYDAIINESTKFVCKHLTYDVRLSGLNPNKVLKSGIANCQGYHALFGTTCNYLFEKHNIPAKAEVRKPSLNSLHYCRNLIRCFMFEILPFRQT
jgi:hypothetical protein